MKYLLIFTTMLFAAEMEVDGNLKVTGTVDANGNPITNVGAPVNASDAVNAGTLASVLSDDSIASLFYEKALAHHFFVNITQGSILRLFPALTISFEEIDKALSLIRLLFEQISATKPV